MVFSVFPHSLCCLYSCSRDSRGPFVTENTSVRHLRDVFGGNNNLMQTKNGNNLGNFGKVGGGRWPQITSGLVDGMSWVMAPRGTWSLERGRGHPAGNWSHPALSAVAGKLTEFSGFPLIYWGLAR